MLALTLTISQGEREWPPILPSPRGEGMENRW